MDVVSCSEEAKARSELRERATLTDRRATALKGEWSLLDSAEQGKKQVELELGESRQAVTCH